MSMSLDLGEFRRRYRADGHGRAASGAEMMVALLPYAYSQRERSSQMIESGASARWATG
jgi:transposase